ncbi:TraC family protein [Aureimonas sp. SK2]|uniref:TraC family protein n=1 Tax=Aureimonas sp. SK2 TaxID=3015992 RepID=UPI002443AB6E|nr:TraC family protein [Aureimonas sp. SK2]
MRKPRAVASGSQTKANALRQQMEELKAEIRRVELEEEAAFGRLARKAGFFTVSIPEDELAKALAQLAATFQKSAAADGNAAGQTQA